MPDKKPYELEFIFKASPHILFNFLTTASGLSQWFADSVDIDDDEFIFNWSGSEERAKCTEMVEEELVRFHWHESDDENDYFEFIIEKSEVTSDTILRVRDFAEESDIKDQKMLWESQIHELQKRVGG